MRVWNLQEKKQEAVLEGHTGGIRCVVITSDNKYISSISIDTTLRIWNLQKKKQEAVCINEHPGIVAITSDNKF